MRSAAFAGEATESRQQTAKTVIYIIPGRDVAWQTERSWGEKSGEDGSGAVEVGETGSVGTSHTNGTNSGEPVGPADESRGVTQTERWDRKNQHRKTNVDEKNDETLVCCPPPHLDALTLCTSVR